MAKTDFSKQIEYLLFTGAIRGDAILQLHRLLKSYEQGTVSAEEMQEAINDFNPDLYVELPPDEV
jgi:hypothetical protein